LKYQVDEVQITTCEALRPNINTSRTFHLSAIRSYNGVFSHPSRWSKSTDLTARRLHCCRAGR